MIKMLPSIIRPRPIIIASPQNFITIMSNGLTSEIPTKATFVCAKCNEIGSELTEKSAKFIHPG